MILIRRLMRRDLMLCRCYIDLPRMVKLLLPTDQASFLLDKWSISEVFIFVNTIFKYFICYLIIAPVLCKLCENLIRFGFRIESPAASPDGWDCAKPARRMGRAAENRRAEGFGRQKTGVRKGSGCKNRRAEGFGLQKPARGRVRAAKTGVRKGYGFTKPARGE